VERVTSAMMTMGGPPAGLVVTIAQELQVWQVWGFARP